MFERNYIHIINILKVLQLFYPFLNASLFCKLIDFTCNLIFSHHLKFTMPSWKKENMRLKNGKVTGSLF